MSSDTIQRRLDAVGDDQRREQTDDDRETESVVHARTANGDPVTVLRDAGPGTWDVACPHCSTYQFALSVDALAVRGFERPCDGCSSVLHEETAAVWPSEASDAVDREMLRLAVRRGVFQNVSTTEWEKITEEVVPGDEVATALLPTPNHRWLWLTPPAIAVEEVADE